MFEGNLLERDGPVLQGVESPQSVPASHEQSVKSDRRDVTARAPYPHESPAAKAPASAVQAEAAQIWVTANFKEIQLDHMRPGDPATLAIDAYAERTIHGHVESVQPGSGTAFSLLPAQNATGNYVKIVQRVPVKIVMDDPPADVALGPGMSVVPTARVDVRPSLYERLRRYL
jgi:Cation efflux system protein CusB domain 1